ncbi:MAG TPA: spore maturation protein A [Firmicutes bacterium]|nr:spore maturation protein A [Bacillota bacterium]
MLNILWVGIMLLSLAAGAATGRLDQVTNALLAGGGEAIQLALTLGGAMCLWGGLMRIAEKGGLTALFARGMAPLMRLLFPRLDPAGPACRAMLMNMAANLLGLGNAATPFGLKAMAELEKENPQPGAASNHMVVFVVLNTASIQLLPTTVATLRLRYGAAAPFDILPAVWLTSFASAAVAVTLAKILGSGAALTRRPPRREKGKRAGKARKAGKAEKSSLPV